MKDWTIMVYMAGDNDLNQDTINAIKGIQTNNPTLNALGASDVAWCIYYDPSTTS